MKKTLISVLAIPLTIIACQKEHIEVRESYDKLFLSPSDFSCDYFPTHSVEGLLQGFFDDLDAYVNEETIEHDFDFYDGIWCLITGLNYTSGVWDTVVNALEVKQLRYELSLNNSNEITANSLLSSFIAMYDSLNEINTGSETVSTIGFDSLSISGETVTVWIEVLYGSFGEYDEIEIDPPESPGGLPSNAQLMMGYPYGAYLSATEYNMIKYDPYLYWSKLAGTTASQRANRLVAISNVSSNYFTGWTDGQNCFYDWTDNPPGDFILVNNCLSEPNAPSTIVTGSQFNTYLDRFWQIRIEPKVNDNLIYNSKWLIVRPTVHWIPACPICGYAHHPDAKSALSFQFWRGTVTIFIDEINTYTF